METHTAPSQLKTLEKKCHMLEEQCKEYIRSLEQTNQRLEGEIEKHRRTEIKLRASEARFRTIFEHAPFGAAMTDLNGRIIMANRAIQEMLGYEKSELEQMHFADITHEKDVGKDLNLFNKLINKQLEHYSLEKRYFTRSGKIVWGSLAVTLIEGPESSDVSVIGMVEDISERKRAYEEIIKARNALETVVAKRTEEIRLLKDRLQAENQFLRQEIRESQQYGEIIGESHSIRTIISQIELVAPTDANVLIQGESGTGKELVAREIHKHSHRRDKTLIKVNCATIPKDLYESEFFGHVKGAFTGAVQDRIGRFEAANGGTLFLDEVGEIPLELQSKMLRVLQEGEFERVGEGKTRRVDVRIIAATNKDLKKEVEARRFRDDLFYRLNVFPILVEPLRKRKDDITPLAFHLVQKISQKMNLPQPDLSKANLVDLIKYDWPGNVRELENAVERAVILCRFGRLQFALPESSAWEGGDIPENAPSDAATGETILTADDFKRLERDNTIRALQRCNWKISGINSASELLGLKSTTLIERMKRFNISRPG